MHIDKSDPIIGRTLGDFSVKKKLGEGGFGAVYKATQITLEREAVIKVLHIKHRTNKDVIARFKREAYLASRLEHPYCAHIYSFGAESDGLLWIAMEYVAGTPLNEILKAQKKLPLEKFVPLLDKICEVVHTAHEANIIHRDIKPANVMIISRAGRLLPKLLDFGIAKGLNQNPIKEKTIIANKVPKESNTINDQETIKDNVLIPQETLIENNFVINNASPKSQNIVDNNSKSQKTIIGSDVNQKVVIDKNIFLKSQKTIIGSDISQNTVITNDNLKNQETIIGNDKSTSQETIVSNQNKYIQDFTKLEEEIPNNRELITYIENAESNISTETFKTQGFIGSPPYMSPEQWQNGKVDARSDIYSLGILTYKVITGALPFKEKGFELYGAHVCKEVPPLREGFPVKVNEVLQKALAKKPENRYQTALEFAKEFRQAANFDEEKALLPEFDEIIKENLLANAPKPIAESLASLLASHNAYQFKDRVLLVFRVLIRYIGILALASYTSTANKQQNNELINKSVSTLYKESLSEAQWIELSRELCRSFAKKRDVFPIPELVTLFFADNDDSPSPVSDLAANLLQLQEKIIMAVSLKEESLIELLEEFLSKLTMLLRKVSWICDYYLVEPKANQATKWMGTSKSFGLMSVKSSNLANEKAMLLDSNGHFVLLLWPLVEIVEPSLGTAKEIFFLDGKARSGTKLVSFPQAFEIETQSAFDWAKEHFFGGEEKAKTDSLLEKSPYLGLASFSPKDSTLFFGREKETESFLNRLRVQPLLAVVGASGAGKSSFVQAGVVACLDKSWSVLTIRPGISPISTLSAKLSKLGLELINLKSDLEKDIECLAKILRMFAIANRGRILIVVDQFEEIFTLCLDKQEQKLYVEALVSLARSEEDPIRVILTMRDDFLVRAKELNALKDRLNQSIEILTIPDSSQLLKILVLPARRVGYEFEDSNLPIEIVNELTGQTSALPLLAFTAAKLWEQRDNQFKQLRRRNYKSMGGVGGALAHHAESMLQQMTQSEQSLVREAFRHLVTSQGTRAILTRLELLQLLGKTTDSEAVIEKLISARLLVATEGEKGIDRIEVIHEALLSTWPRLVKWRQEDAEGARLRDQLRSAARQWQERNYPKGLLWRDEVLTEYQLWRTHYKGKLTEVEEEFAQISLSDATRSQRIKQALVIMAIVILLMVSSIMFYQRQQTEKQLLKTLELYEEQGRQEILKGKFDRAAVYLSEAYAKGDSSLTLRYMLSVALAKVENHPPITLSNHTDVVTMVSFSPDDTLVATSSMDKTARIWQTTDGKELFVLKGHESPVISSRFSFDGQFLVTASVDKTARIWKVSDGSLVAVLQGHTDALRGAEFSPDGKKVLTWSYDQTAKIWDTTTSKLLNTLEGHLGAIYAASYSKSGKLIATASSDQTAKVWDSSSGQLKNTLNSHQAAVVNLAFSPDEKLLVTASTDKTAKVWQLEDGKLLDTLANHQSGVTNCKFSPDGKEILTTSADTRAYLWESSTRKLLWTLESHTGDIVSGDFSFDGNLIITSSYDNTVRVWEKNTGKFLVAFTEHKNSVIAAIFSSKTDKILSASEDRTAKIWQLEVERRSPLEISKIVKEKVPIELIEGRLISTQPVIQEVKKEVIKTQERPGENLYIENIGSGINLEMVKIQAGEFEMGSPVSEKGRNADEQLHKVKISKDFYIGRFEVTQAQWRIVAGLPTINISLKSDPSGFKGDNLPVEQVSWHEVVEFCARLSKLTGKQYRLPTEAEWEYVARAGSKNNYPENLDELAWYDKNSEGRTHAVGQKKANPWGLYDIYGNVYEWCLDLYGNYPSATVIDPSGANLGVYRVFRGGNWKDGIIHCRSAYRSDNLPTESGRGLGFRLLRSLE
ncbi:MAG: SUMF1/EgtB/PvdO family nonheme iron enzyme [Acidobacteria bacterium]|nr:SUMF1/EgtB/PvdO family nonheme iron enzyme [Acidobacteriota bacterium]